MIYRQPRVDEELTYEKLSKHPLQSWYWGEFRQKTGVSVERLLGFEESQAVSQLQVTFHPLPYFDATVGYYPKGRWPNQIELKALLELGQAKKAVFIKLEPDVSTPPYKPEQLEALKTFLLENGCQEGRALFTPHTFIIDLNKSEDELLAKMKSKTRYNLRLAQKKGVEILEDTTDQGFADYLNLLKLTTRRQEFYAHNEDYQTKMWQQLSGTGIAKILKAVYQGKVLTAWILFKYKDTLYYPYGASSREHPEVMASNLIMWEAMRLGKSWGAKSFDLWGSLGPDPDPKDPWYGFHRFKEGYGGELASFVGTYDLLIDPNKYKLFRLVDRWRWRFLRLKKKLPFLG